jgi:hypothetical protein
MSDSLYNAARLSCCGVVVGRSYISTLVSDAFGRPFRVISTSIGLEIFVSIAKTAYLLVASTFLVPLISPTHI